MFDLLNILNLVLTQFENCHWNLANIDPLPFWNRGGARMIYRRMENIYPDTNLPFFG